MVNLGEECVFLLFAAVENPSRSLGESLMRPVPAPPSHSELHRKIVALLSVLLLERIHA